MLGENNHQEDPHQQQNQANQENQQHKNDNQHLENQEAKHTHEENQQNKQQENIQHNQHDNQEHHQKQEDVAKEGHHQTENEDLHKQRVVGELEQIAQALLNNQKNQSNQQNNQQIIGENQQHQHQEENHLQKSDQNQKLEHLNDQKNENLNEIQHNNEQEQNIQSEKHQDEKHENYQEQKQQQESHNQEVGHVNQQKEVKHNQQLQEQHQQQKIVIKNDEQTDQSQDQPHQEDFQQNQQQDQHQRKEQQKLTLLESVQEALKGHEHDAFPIPQQAEKEVNDDNDEDVEIKEEPIDDKFNQFETPTIGQFDENNSQKFQQEQEQQQIQQEQQQAKEENPNFLQYQKSLQEGLNLKAQGNNFFSNKNYLDAIGVYSSALGLCQGYYMAQCPIELFPQFKQLQLQLLSNLAACYLELGFHNECITFSSQVLSIDPLNTKALYRRATAYQKKGDLEEAFRDIDQAFELNKKSPIEDSKINDKRMEIRYQLKQFQQEHKKDSQQMYQKMFSQSERKTQSESKQENQQQKLSQSEILHKPQQQSNIEIKQQFSYSNAVLKFVGSILISTAATKYIMEQKIESKQGIISQLVVGGSFLGIVQLKPTWQKMLAGAIGSGFIAFVLFQRKR